MKNDILGTAAYCDMECTVASEEGIGSSNFQKCVPCGAFSSGIATGESNCPSQVNRI